ncbi:MAG: hypothetical protein EP344_17565 [Bacteroidetes bacterium]|nr:MAG: hypothetical protein EP344_17565 [Bacteroidota bacterium]
MNTTKLTAVYILFTLIFLGFRQLASGQGTEAPSTFFEYLTQEEGGRLTLEMDLTSLLEDRQNQDYTTGTLQLKNGTSISVKVKPKGKFRRARAFVPPLKIKVSKDWLRGAGLDTLNETKLVLPYFDTRQGDQLIIKEYLIYRMFERLSHASTRARLVQVTLRDNHAGHIDRKMYGMLLEDNEEIAARLHGVEIDRFGLPMDSMVASQAALVALFEYMIGNTDWDLSMQRNVRLIKPNAGGKILLVPYDFDFSGLVRAPYASPSSESGLDNVLDRFLMTNGLHQADLRRAAQTLKSAKKDLYDICYSRHLTRDATNEMLWYLDTFFDAIDKNNDVPVRLGVTVRE